MTVTSEAGGKGCGHDQSGAAKSRHQHSADCGADHTVEHGADHAACGGCHHHHHHSLGGERVPLGFAVLAAILLLVGWISGTFFSFGQNRLGPLGIAQWIVAASFFFGGFFAFIEAVEGLWARRFHIDFLMVAAAIGAAYIGHAGEGALLLVLFSLGHAAEHYALGRAQRSIEALAKLRPTTATVWDQSSGQTREVAIERLEVGDIVVVRPDSRIAADGVVVMGESDVDQSAVTGESIPVDKSPMAAYDPAMNDWKTLPAEHKLFAGTINGGGVMRLKVTRTADDTTLARVMRLVTEARINRSPTQRLTDTFERYFVPAVLAFVCLLMLAFTVIDEPFSRSLYRGIAVLVAASPCALAIATPSAVLSAVARGGREGVLFKGGGPLEQLGSVKSIALDKTGTLTVGKPAVVEVVVAESHAKADVLAIAAAVERQSDHPLAGAILRAADAARPHRPVDAWVVRDVKRLTGRGIHAEVDGQPIWLGNSNLFDASAAGPPSVAAPPPLVEWVKQADRAMREHGRTTVIVCYADEFLGVIGLLDVARPSAKGMVDSLRQIGIKDIVMLSGDNQRAAAAIGRQVGIDRVFGDLSPEDKVDAIELLERSGPVAMIGDGANDAPALAAATVSVAIAAAGSDVALETADVALMGDDLGKLPLAVSLSRQASRVIRQNLWISLGMIAILVPASLMGLQLAVAVVFHEGSTLLVVANALRILTFDPAAVRR
jgi:Cd2+/Zn2+-exporting ATPase